MLIVCESFLSSCADVFDPCYCVFCSYLLAIYVFVFVCMSIYFYVCVGHVCLLVVCVFVNVYWSCMFIGCVCIYECISVVFSYAYWSRFRVLVTCVACMLITRVCYCVCIGNVLVCVCVGPICVDSCSHMFL
jgi:hypothetical protein